MLTEVTLFENIPPSDKYSIVIETHMHVYLSFPKCPPGVVPCDTE